MSNEVSTGTERIVLPCIKVQPTLVVGSLKVVSQRDALWVSLLWGFTACVHSCGFARLGVL